MRTARISPAVKMECRRCGEAETALRRMHVCHVCGGERCWTCCRVDMTPKQSRRASAAPHTRTFGRLVRMICSECSPSPPITIACDAGNAKASDRTAARLVLDSLVVTWKHGRSTEYHDTAITIVDDCAILLDTARHTLIATVVWSTLTTVTVDGDQRLLSWGSMTGTVDTIVLAADHAVLARLQRVLDCYSTAASRLLASDVVLEHDKCRVELRHCLVDGSVNVSYAASTETITTIPLHACHPQAVNSTLLLHNSVTVESLALACASSEQASSLASTLKQHTTKTRIIPRSKCI